MRPLSIHWIYYALFKKKEAKKNYKQLHSSCSISKYFVFADYKQILCICKSFFIILIFIFSMVSKFYPGFLGNGQTAPFPRR